MEGIFRLSGSAKRIKDLQTVFNSPPKYGKGLSWEGFTVHDSANVLRRYLNQLPEPIVPLEFYERFRDPLRPYATRNASDSESQPIDMTLEQHSTAVTSYQTLITELGPLNRQLLLYLLDLLAVFASKSDLNRMPAPNLAAIFQPGIISHPQHDMAPVEYRLSQDVLIFLIENQDNFLIGMTGTAVDEKTLKDVESGAASTRSPLHSSSVVGRSASNASAGADSLRKFGVRRNVSVSSGTSRERGSPGVSSPGTPTGMSQLSTVGSNTGGIARSNTVPSKRSPALAGTRFQRMQETAVSTSPGTATDAPATPGAETQSEDPAADVQPPQRAPTSPTLAQSPSFGPVSGATKERKISNLFSKSPFLVPEAQTRPTKKLQKRSRIPGSANESAASSQASLQGEENSTFHTPLVSPTIASASRPDPIVTYPQIQNTSATPVETPTSAFPPIASNEKPAGHLQPHRSPPGSLHSRSSVTDHSEFDALDNAISPTGVPGSPPEKEKRRHRWRFSSSARRTEDIGLPPPPLIGNNAGARGSNSSFGSSRARKSFTGDSGGLGSSQHEREGSMMTGQSMSMVGASTHSRESGELLRDVTNTNSNTSTEEKKGLFGKWKAKLGGERSEQKKLEKERAKSPPATGHGQPRGSLSAVASPSQPPRNRSFEASRGSQSSTESGTGPLEGQRIQAPTLETVKERPVTEAKERAEMSGLSPPDPPPPMPAASAAPTAPNATVPQSTSPDVVSQPAVPITPAAPAESSSEQQSAMPTGIDKPAQQ